jgi:hypothetical protein
VSGSVLDLQTACSDRRWPKTSATEDENGAQQQKKKTWFSGSR